MIWVTRSSKTIPAFRINGKIADKLTSPMRFKVAAKYSPVSNIARTGSPLIGAPETFAALLATPDVRDGSNATGASQQQVWPRPLCPQSGSNVTALAAPPRALARWWGSIRLHQLTTRPSPPPPPTPPHPAP